MFPENVIIVMIAGFSDMISEVECAKNVIYEWNEMNAPTYGLALCPIHWKTSSFPSLSYSDAQAPLPIEYANEIWETLYCSTSEPIKYAHGCQIAVRVISLFGEKSLKC